MTKFEYQLIKAKRTRVTPQMPINSPDSFLMMDTVCESIIMILEHLSNQEEKFTQAKTFINTEFKEIESNIRLKKYDDALEALERCRFLVSRLILNFDQDTNDKKR